MNGSGFILFYDTNILLRIQEKAFEEPFCISSQTLIELEDIKTSGRKDEETKAQARQVVRLLNNPDAEFTVCLETNETTAWLNEQNLPKTPDNIIIASAAIIGKSEPIEFATDDLACRLMADACGVKIASSVFDEKEEYKGWRIIEMNNDQLAELYSELAWNVCELELNEYAIIKFTEQEGRTDIVKWDGESTKRVGVKLFKSRWFDTVKPKDEYQRCAIDALLNKEMVVLSGRAGSGKTLLSLSYLFQQLENQQIRKLYIIGHFEPLKGSRQLGFVPGDRLTKQLCTGSLGNILATKLGGMAAVDSMIAADMLQIISTSDIRGIEFGSEDAVYCSEAEDLDCYTLATLVQRCKAGCKQIYEGDMRQVDISRRSGFAEMVDVFKGAEQFACVKLKEDYRNPLSALADKLMGYQGH